jgi:prepilin-type processing-associated H-X9-DG protein
MKSIAVCGVEINQGNRGFRGQLGWVVLTFLLLAFSGRLWAAVPNLVTTDLSTIDRTCNLGFVDGHAESVELNNLKSFYWHEL